MLEFLHKEDFVLDSHCDTPTMLLEEIDLGKRQPRGHVDFVRAREGGVDGMFRRNLLIPRLQSMR